MPTIRELIFLAAGLLAAIGISSRATELQLELGQCRLQQVREGVFWQSNLPHHNYLSPRCAEVALAGRFNATRLGWRLGVLATGNIEARGNVATYRDDEIGQGDLHCQGSDPSVERHGRGCHALHRGAGNLDGIRAGLTYEVDLPRSLRLVPEAGLLFFRSEWRSDARHLDCANCGAGIGGDAGGYAGGKRTDFFAAPPSPYAGAALRYGNVYIAARYHLSLDHRDLSLTSNSFLQLSAGIAFGL